MKKASQKSSNPTPNLGAKRVCPECNTKFYDFGKQAIVCPKCETEIDVQALAQQPRPVVEVKKPKPVEKAAPEEALLQGESASEETEVLESVDDLGDEDEDIVEDLEVEEEEELDY